MTHLYVCHFSNGHIKVGRSIEPKGRIASHAERVSCMGVELVEHHIEECVGPSESREAELIRRCADAATRKHKNEWFVGLDYLSVVEWVGQCARLELPAVRHLSEGAVDFRAVIAFLKSRGINQIDLAAACHCGQSSISDIATGRTKDPSYSIGVALLALTADKPAQTPQRS